MRKVLSIDEAYTTAEALYWFCVDNHGGQGCPLYGILSSLDFHPSALATKPSEEAQVIYDAIAESDDVFHTCELLDMDITIACLRDELECEKGRYNNLLGDFKELLIRHGEAQVLEGDSDESTK